MCAADPQQPSIPASIEGYKHGRVPRALRERQLLDVAEGVFTEIGFDGSSIEEVSRRSGIKRPLFYTYFGGKNGLYLACYRRAREELDQRLATAAAAAATGERSPEAFHQVLHALAHAYFSFLANAPSRWDMLYGPGAATAGEIAEEVAELRFGTVLLLADVLRKYADPSTEASTILSFAHAGSGACEQLAHWWRRTPDIAIDELASLATKFNWNGLAQVLSPH